MNVIKERIDEIISNSLTKDFEVSEVNNVQYMNGSPKSEIEVRAIIKSKSDSDFIGYIWVYFNNGFEYIANMSFCKNIITNFPEVFIDGNDVINKMKQYSNELSLIYNTEIVMVFIIIRNRLQIKVKKYL